MSLNTGPPLKRVEQPGYLRSSSLCAARRALHAELYEDLPMIVAKGPWRSTSKAPGLPVVDR